MYYNIFDLSGKWIDFRDKMKQFKFHKAKLKYQINHDYFTPCLGMFNVKNVWLTF